MLVRAHDRAVDHGVFAIRIGRQHLEYLLPHSALRPARKSCVDIDFQNAPASPAMGGQRENGRSRPPQTATL